MNEDGCDLRGNFYLEDAPGGTTWTAYLTPIVSPSYLFPQVVATAERLVRRARRGPASAARTTRPTEFRVSRLAAAGTPFACPTGWQGGPWTQVVAAVAVPRRRRRRSRRSRRRPTAGSASRSTDFGGNVFLIESSQRHVRRRHDHDPQPHRTTPTPRSPRTDSTSTQYRAVHPLPPRLQRHHAERGVERAAGAPQRRQRSSTSTTAAASGTGAPARRRRDREAGAGRRGRPLRRRGPRALSGPLSGFNTHLGGLAAGRLLGRRQRDLRRVAALRRRRGRSDRRRRAAGHRHRHRLRRHRAAASRRGAGRGRAPQNLTQTPTTDERFFSLAARNPAATRTCCSRPRPPTRPACAIIGDRGTAPGNVLRRIAYLERPITARSLVVGDPPADARRDAVAARVAQSRARRGVGSRCRAADAATHVEVLAVERTARRARGAPAADRRAGTDATSAAARVPAGLYLARVEGRRRRRP